MVHAPLRPLLRLLSDLAQEHGLYVIGLCRLRDWTEQLPELIDKADSLFGSGNFSEVDQVLDQICGNVLDPKEFRAKLVRIALSVPHGTPRSLLTVNI